MAPRSPDAIGITKFTLIAVTTILSAALALVAWLDGQLPGVRLRSVWPFAVFVMAMGLATVFSVNPTLSFIGLQKRYGGFSAYLIYAVLAVLVVALYRTKPWALRGLVYAVIVGATVNALYVIAQQFGLDFFEWRTALGTRIYNPFGGMGQSNFAGGFHGIVVPLIVYAVMTTHGWRRVLFGSVAVLDVFATWFTSARGGLLAIVAGLAVFVFVLRGRLPRIALVAIGLALAAALFSGALILSRTDQEVSDPGARRDWSASATFARGETARIRSFYWQAALRMAADRPLLGWGPDTYGQLYSRYRTADDGRELGLNLTDKAHNVFLDHLAGAGAVGLAAYLALVLFCLAKGYSAARRLRGSHQVLAAGVLAALIGYLAQSSLSIDMPPLAATGWLLMGATVALANGREGDSTTQMRQRGSQPVTVTVVIVLAATMTVLALRPLRANLRLGSALLHASTAGQTTELRDALEDAIRLNPWDPGIRTDIAIFHVNEASGLDRLARRAELERALHQELEAWRLQPGKVQYAVNLARLYEGLAGTGEPRYFEDSARWWQRAANIDPSDWQVHHQRGLLLHSWGKATGNDAHLRAAARSIERAIETSKPRALLWRALGHVYRDLGDEDQAAAAFEAAERGTSEPVSGP
jgi:hypothetical protein